MNVKKLTLCSAAADPRILGLIEAGSSLLRHELTRWPSAADVAHPQSEHHPKRDITRFDQVCAKDLAVFDVV